MLRFWEGGGEEVETDVELRVWAFEVGSLHALSGCLLTRVLPTNLQRFGESGLRLWTPM